MKAVAKKLKEEQMRKLAILGEQYEQSIAEMLQQQNVSIGWVNYWVGVVFQNMGPLYRRQKYFCSC